MCILVRNGMLFVNIQRPNMNRRIHADKRGTDLRLGYNLGCTVWMTFYIGPRRERFFGRGNVRRDNLTSMRREGARTCVLTKEVSTTDSNLIINRARTNHDGVNHAWGGSWQQRLAPGIPQRFTRSYCASFAK